jgi:lambda family phage minor tail protein L
MAGEGRNQVASSLLDLQPTAVLEFFQIFPDPLNLGTRRINFHGGSLFGDVITWQGIEYIPTALEAEGFETYGDKRLARPTIRISNENNQITRLLQDHKDLINAQVVRKKAFIKNLDDVNFDGGNPFGAANPEAEISSETWLIGQKLQENKVFVEFELNSPLDLESFDVNYRSIIAKYCYWQYRGEGCRYEGLPIERDDGESFTDPTGGTVAPIYRHFSRDPLVAGDNPASFFDDPDAEYAINREYQKGDVVVLSNNKILIHPYGPETKVTDAPVKLKTVYVCASGNSGEYPEGNPTYWQKDGCTKKLGACRKRFNDTEDLGFYQNSAVASGFKYITFSGTNTLENTFGYADDVMAKAGAFYSNNTAITGVLTPSGAWTIAGWVNANNQSSDVAGIFSTTRNSVNSSGLYDFLNITLRSGSDDGSVGGFYRQDGPPPPAFISTKEGINEDIGPLADVVEGFELDTDAEMIDMGSVMSYDWYFYAISNEGMGTIEPILYADTSDGTRLNAFIGNGALLNKVDFGSFFTPKMFKNEEIRSLSGYVPSHFMLGTIPYGTGSGHASMNGQLGPWALWNRALNDEEVDFLYKDIENPIGTANPINYVPRPFEECTGLRASITGVVEGSGLVAWWDMTTGDLGGGLTGLIDKTENNYFLTGSGFYGTGEKPYVELNVLERIANPSTPYPRFGGYPGTDGFGYGEGSQV